VTIREAVSPAEDDATAMKSESSTTGTSAMNRYETMSFVRMRQSRRSETQRKARHASQAANSQAPPARAC
jgi:hypothetical protein